MCCKNNGSGLCVIILLNNGMMGYVFRENLWCFDHDLEFRRFRRDESNISRTKRKETEKK